MRKYRKMPVTAGILALTIAFTLTCAVLATGNMSGPGTAGSGVGGDGLYNEGNVITGDGKALVNGKEVAFKSENGIKAAPAAAAAPAGGQEVKAPVPGTILRVSASNGQKVAKGDEILVMDVMKMETPVTAPCDGTVTVMVNATDKVATGDVLAVIG